MATFQEVREQTEQKVIAQLLSEIEHNPSFTQRKLAADLGIALGLMNQYLKRCITKGWVRGTQISARRLKFFLTPEGFKEKSNMVANYLASSFGFFRDAKSQCELIFYYCNQHNWRTIGLLGIGDLADIALLIGNNLRLNIVVINEIKNIINLNTFDAFLITDLQNPQAMYDAAKKYIGKDRLLTIDLLKISRI